MKAEIMKMTLNVEVNSPAAAAMVLDTMDAASDPDEELSESALVSDFFSQRACSPLLKH